MTGFIGVLSLDTAFPRIAGDAGNPESYHRPARVRVVATAGSPDIVRDGRPAPALVAAFCVAAQELEAEGASALTSTCGFLVTVQRDIAQAVGIPVILSALSMGPVLLAMHGGRPLGIITASRPSLGEVALKSAGIDREDCIIAGMEDSPDFALAFLGPKTAQPAAIDSHAIEVAAVAGAMSLCEREPDLGAILLECGNLPPYAAAITRATGKPVYSILDAMRIILP